MGVRLLLLALLAYGCAVSPATAGTTLPFVPTAIPEAPPNWDAFTIREPKKGDTNNAAKVISIYVTDAFPHQQGPVIENLIETHYIKYTMTCSARGPLTFARSQYLAWIRPSGEVFNQYVPPLDSTEIQGLGFFTAEDIRCFVQALHACDRHLQSPPADYVNQTVARSKRYVFSIEVGRQGLFLKIEKEHLTGDFGIVSREDKAWFVTQADGVVPSVKFNAQEVRVFKFLLSRVADLQEKLAAAERRSGPP